MKKQIELAGKNIFYQVIGKGKPVMLVHGYGEAGEVWTNQVSFLKENYHLIVPDLPGSGQSDLIEDMSMEALAEVLKAIVDKEVKPEGAPISMIGHSMGGYISLAFLEKYSSYLSAFGLFHSTAFADTEEKKDTRKKSIEFIGKHGSAEYLKSAIPNLFSEQTNEQNPGLITEFIRSTNNFSDKSLVSYLEAMMKRPDRAGLLKTTQLPILFVLGDFDNTIPLADGLKLAQLPEKSYIHILHRSGHMGMLEEEENSNQILKKYLSET